MSNNIASFFTTRRTQNDSIFLFHFHLEHLRFLWSFSYFSKECPPALQLHLSRLLTWSQETLRKKATMAHLTFHLAPASLVPSVSFRAPFGLLEELHRKKNSPLGHAVAKELVQVARAARQICVLRFLLAVPALPTQRILRAAAFSHCLG